MTLLDTLTTAIRERARLRRELAEIEATIAEVLRQMEQD